MSEKFVPTITSREVFLNAWRSPGMSVKKFWSYKEFPPQEIREETYKEWSLLTEKGYDFCYFSEYPGYLEHRELPPCFWYKGDISLFKEGPMVGIVGSRHIPESLLPRVREHCHNLIKSLEGEVIASGLALGCDTLAHSMQPRSVAFLPCSIDKVYPWSNRDLKREIEEKGLCISPWSPFLKDIVNRVRLFERTNFLIECCKVIYVLHANERSGTEYTIRKALQRGRKVILFTYGREDHPLELKYPKLEIKQVE